MCDEWMPVVQIPMSLEHYHQLPRHPAYKYEYLNRQALLTPRAKFYHARLQLSRFAVGGDLSLEQPLTIELLKDDDFPALVQVFQSAFRDLQPYASLDDASRERAAEQSLEKTRTGGDGPRVPSACLVAREQPDGAPVGALMVTLLPKGDPTDFDSYYWDESPPVDLVERRGGRPHLTWVFVQRSLSGQGAATYLLSHAVAALRALDYTELYSTFLLGNHASMMWHWRMGFELLSDPYSLRRMRREIKQTRRHGEGETRRNEEGRSTS